MDFPMNQLGRWSREEFRFAERPKQLPPLSEQMSHVFLYFMNTQVGIFDFFSEKVEVVYLQTAAADFTDSVLCKTFATVYSALTPC